MAQKDAEKFWDSLLDFFCLEIFGQEIFEGYQRGDYMLHLDPIKEGVEKPAPWVPPHELKIWCICKCVALHQRANARNLPSWKNDFLGHAGKGLLDLFWAMAQRHEQSGDFSTAVRKGSDGKPVVVVFEEQKKPTTAMPQIFRIGG